MTNRLLRWLAGNMLYRGYGAAIDRHDFVIRVNGAITLGYERDVGRARHQFVVGWYAGLRDAFVRGQLCCGTLAVVTSNNGGGVGAIPWEASQAPHIAVQPGFMDRAFTTVGRRGTWPSTGFLAIAFGLAVARYLNARISVYGFGACSRCNKYFDCDGSNSTE